MPRKPRFTLPGYPQHVIQRGNNREPCFFGDDDCHAYLDRLQEATARYACQLHAYVLMTNHVHLLITPQTENGIAHLMQRLGQRYVHFINHSYQRTGTLWDGRYKANLIDTEAYLLTCMRYIELNPVRAQMVSFPGEYRWSSYQSNGYGKSDPLIATHALYRALGSNSDSRCHAYRELFRHNIDNAQLHVIRDALNQELVLGRDDFKDKIEQITKRQTRRGQDGRPRIEEVGGVYRAP